MVKFEKLFEKLVKENRIDKSGILRKLKNIDHTILEEGEGSQFNDDLLNE